MLPPCCKPRLPPHVCLTPRKLLAPKLYPCQQRTQARPSREGIHRTPNFFFLLLFFLKRRLQNRQRNFPAALCVRCFPPAAAGGSAGHSPGSERTESAGNTQGSGATPAPPARSPAAAPAAAVSFSVLLLLLLAPSPFPSRFARKTFFSTPILQPVSPPPIHRGEGDKKAQRSPPCGNPRRLGDPRGGPHSGRGPRTPPPLELV